MTTINDLSVASSVSSDDKFPIWQNANGVTRALPVSVLDGRYLTQDDVAQLAADAKVEMFISSILPNPTGLPTFVAGTTTSLTLANQYYSAENIEPFFDASFQGPDQYSLVGYGLNFTSPIPLGVQMVYIRGGAARIIGAPSDGTVTDSSAAPGSKLSNRINAIIYVDDFNAVGDGITDDSAAIQAAINYAKTFPDGAEVHFNSKKKYAIGSQINVLNGVEQRVALRGNSATLLAKSGFVGNYLISLGYTDASIQTHGLILSGLQINGNTSKTGVLLQNANGALLADNFFQSCVNGIEMQTSYAVTLRDNKFQNTGQFGVWSNDDTKHLTIDGCGFYDTGNYAVWFGGFVYDIAFRDVDFEGGSSAVTFNSGAAAVTFDHCYIESFTGAGGPIFIFGTVSGLRVLGCWLGYNTATQLWQRISGGQLTGNVFANQQQSIDSTTCFDFDVGANDFIAGSNFIFTPNRAPTLINGFTNTGSTHQVAGFRKNAAGDVVLRGMIQAAADNVAFVLPAGYRPGAVERFACLANNGTLAAITVFPDGSVTPVRGSDGTVDLAGVRFVAQA